MPVYYNEFDPFAAEWLRNLIAEGLIADGEVDERSICDVQPDELREFSQVHFFAGVGGWSLALRLAGVADDFRLWTGSCPCQPYSSAGKRKGDEDERNLWPHMFRLIRECKPAVVFGEQVASAGVIGRANRKNEDVQQVQDREALFGILRELEGESPSDVRRLLSVVPGEQAKEQGVRFQELQGMEGLKTRSCTCERGKGQSQSERVGVLAVPEGHPASYRGREVRSIRDSIRPVATESMELPFSGPQRFDERVHTGERESCSICPQCGGECLGGERDYSDRDGDFREAQRELEQLVRAYRAEADATTSDWYSGIYADLVSAGYNVGSSVLSAASVGAPHIRQRLFWVGNSQKPGPLPATLSGVSVEEAGTAQQRGRNGGRFAGSGRDVGGMDDPICERYGSGQGIHVRRRESGEATTVTAGASPWSNFRTVACRDGKTRRISSQSGDEPLAYGIPREVVQLLAGVGGVERSAVKAARGNRVGRLKAYGNAIVPQVAAEFIRAFMEVRAC